MPSKLNNTIQEEGWRVTPGIPSMTVLVSMIRGGGGGRSSCPPHKDIAQDPPRATQPRLRVRLRGLPARAARSASRICAKDGLSFHPHPKIVSLQTVSSTRFGHREQIWLRPPSSRSVKPTARTWLRSTVGSTLGSASCPPPAMSRCQSTQGDSSDAAVVLRRGE